MKAINSTILLLFISLSIVFNSSAQTPAKTVPDFTFFKSNKIAFTIKDLDPNNLLFFVFFDVTCDHCQQEMVKINKHYGEFKKTSLYLISLDDPQRVNQFLNAYGKNLVGKSNVTLLFDLKNEFIVKFGPKRYPSTFLYSPQKKLILYDDNPENFNKFLAHIKSANK